MTALDDYAKLEAEAQYFDGIAPGARAVVVSFGKRSLVISDFADLVLAHWPLASLSLHAEEEDGDAVAVTPDPQGVERVVLQDPEMISAIRRVCGPASSAPAPRRVRRRGGWRLAVLALALLVGAGWLALSRTAHLAGFLPPERARALGAAMELHFSRTAATGGSAVRICRAGEGLAALDRLVDRLLPAQPLPHPLRVAVVDRAEVDAVALPGGQLLMYRGVLDQAQSPEEVAGVLVHLMAHVIHGDPLRQALGAAREQAVAGLALGDMEREGVVVPAVAAALSVPPPAEVEQLADTTAHDMLADAGLPSLPYANFLTRTGGLGLHPDPGGRARAAAEADRIGASAFAPALDDRDWIALQNVCG